MANAGDGRRSRGHGNGGRAKDPIWNEYEEPRQVEGIKSKRLGKIYNGTC